MCMLSFHLSINIEKVLDNFTLTINYKAITLYHEFFRMFSLPIHISDNNICVQVWATNGRSLDDTASLRQVELLQFFSS